MKSPDEIKKGLEYCSKVKGKCKDCPCYSDSECSIHLAADALAYIQQLDDHIRDLTKMMPKWISVEDDIPTDDYDVLACVGNKEIAIAWFDGYTGEWHAYGSCEGDVTHWMPMPEPPKEV